MAKKTKKKVAPKKMKPKAKSKKGGVATSLYRGISKEAGFSVD